MTRHPPKRAIVTEREIAALGDNRGHEPRRLGLPGIELGNGAPRWCHPLVGAGAVAASGAVERL